MRPEFKHNPIGFLLMASYAYYNLGAVHIMEDYEFDELARYYWENKDQFKSHQHFHLIPSHWGEHGSSGLEFYPADLPNIVKSATVGYLKRTDRSQFELAKDYIDDPMILQIYYD